MKLFIVESPTKIKTLQKILKNNFIFRATLGHIKDLPEKEFGIDLNTFSPRFLYLPKKRKILSELKKLSSKVKEVYLATDPDREGEAISYHIYEYLYKNNSKLDFKRIDLIEITETGVKNALLHPRKIDPCLYESWLTRRILDRLIGYLISPHLSKMFKTPLSAGRVQSIALRLIVEKEEEIENFVPQTTYSLKIILEKENLKIPVELYFQNKLYKTTNKNSLLELCKNELLGKNYFLKEIKEKIEKKAPSLPLKTTTLIELSQKILKYQPKETMKYAQNLYENGYITYMRTDSVRVSDYAERKAKEFIETYFGKEYIGKRREIKLERFAQDAHECIRPTDIFRESVPLSPKEKALYQLIRLYFIASQMCEAKYLVRTYVFVPEKLQKESTLKATYKKLIFDGFLKILRKEKEEVFIELKKGEIFKFSNFKIKKHISEPPPRYTPATLIRKLESMGIGRPSTYPTLLDILYKRKYVIREKNYLKPTELGIKVCKFLVKNFPEIFDYQFTAKMEEDLEKIVNQEKTYLEIVKPCYELLRKYLDRNLRQSATK